MQTYIRWQKGTPRAGRVFPGMNEEDRAGYALQDDEELCNWCNTTLFDGTPVQLVAMGPVDLESAIRFDRGGWITSLAVTVHVTCVAESKVDQ